MRTLKWAMVAALAACAYIGPPGHHANGQTGPGFVSTFFGDDRTGNSLGLASIAIDRHNQVILAGRTRSNRFPATRGAVKSELTGEADLFVAKFDANLKTLVAATLLGGTGDESRCAVALDANDDLYITGLTTSKDFPNEATMLGRPSGEGPAQMFALKLSRDLSAILSSAILSIEPSSNTGPGEIVFDDRRQRLIVGGTTASKGFPTTPGAFQVANTTEQAKKFAAILDPALTKITAATLLGGSTGADLSLTGLVTDSAGHVFVAGNTTSRTHPTTARAFKPAVKDDGDYGVVSKLSPDLSTLLASTYVGETGNDFVYAIALDRREDVVFAGHVTDAMPTTPRAFLRTNRGNPDVANVGILSNDLSTLVASTFVCGGGEGIWAGGFSLLTQIVVDRAGWIYVGGLSELPHFPTTPGAFDDTHNGKRDVVIVRMGADLSSLAAATYLGGSGYDHVHAMNLDRTGRIVVMGETPSRDFPTSAGAYQIAFQERRAYFVTKLGANLADPERSPVYDAAQIGDLARLRTLVARDVSLLRAKDRSGRSILHWAARFGRLETVKWLIGQNADLNAQDGEGQTPLHLAALRGKAAVAELLVESGADIDRANNGGDSPLHLAAVTGDEAIVRFLVARKANLNLRNGQGNTALHRAVFSRHRAVAQVLLDGGADPAAKNESGESPLHLAVMTHRNEETVGLLIKAGARINEPDAKRQTPLHIAAGYYWETNALVLLNANPEVNLQDEEGQTPLHHGVRRSSVRIVRALLEKGADPIVLDKKGKSPIDLARDAKKEEILALLEKRPRPIEEQG